MTESKSEYAGNHITEYLTQRVAIHSSNEDKERLFYALKLARSYKGKNLYGRTREMLIEPALAINLASMRIGQMIGSSWLEHTPVNMEIASAEGKRYFNPRGVMKEGTKYGATGALSALSAAGLEALAIPAGVAIAAVNPLSESDTRIALACLGASYIFWLSGMKANADAAWNALENHGISNSTFGKFGHDLGKRLTDHKKIQGFVYYLGFGSMELVKEIPYYAAAFGLTKGTELFAPELYSLVYTPNMEISFLAGANVAAGFFNYTQATLIPRISNIWDRLRNRVE